MIEHEATTDMATEIEIVIASGIEIVTLDVDRHHRHHIKVDITTQWIDVAAEAVDHTIVIELPMIHAIEIVATIDTCRLRRRVRTTTIRDRRGRPTIGVARGHRPSRVVRVVAVAATAAAVVEAAVAAVEAAAAAVARGVVAVVEAVEVAAARAVAAAVVAVVVEVDRRRVDPGVDLKGVETAAKRIRRVRRPTSLTRKEQTVPRTSS